MAIRKRGGDIMGVFGTATYGHDGYGDTDNMFITDRTENDLYNDTYKAYLNPEHMQWLYNRITAINRLLGIVPYTIPDYTPTSSSPISYLYIHETALLDLSRSTTSPYIVPSSIKSIIASANRQGYTYNPEFEIPDTLDKANIYMVNNIEHALYDISKILGVSDNG